MKKCIFASLAMMIVATLICLVACEDLSKYEKYITGVFISDESILQKADGTQENVKSQLEIDCYGNHDWKIESTSGQEKTTLHSGTWKMAKVTTPKHGDGRTEYVASLYEGQKEVGSISYDPEYVDEAKEYLKPDAGIVIESDDELTPPARLNMRLFPMPYYVVLKTDDGSTLTMKCYREEWKQ